MRSKIRIRDGRAKPIDLLAQYINPDEDDLEYQMHEPYSVLVVSPGPIVEVEFEVAEMLTIMLTSWRAELQRPQLKLDGVKGHTLPASIRLISHHRAKLEWKGWFGIFS